MLDYVDLIFTCKVNEVFYGCVHFKAIIWITELCDVLTKTQVEAVQPNVDIDALNAEQQKFERTAHVRCGISLLACLDDIILIYYD